MWLYNLKIENLKCNLKIIYLVLESIFIFILCMCVCECVCVRVCVCVCVCARAFLIHGIIQNQFLT